MPHRPPLRLPSSRPAAPLALKAAVANVDAPLAQPRRRARVVARPQRRAAPRLHHGDGRWRLPVTVADVDPIFLKMLFAYEDRRFREHHGVDVSALFRAAFQLVTRWHLVSGASTITMQVARLLSTERSTRSVQRQAQPDSDGARAREAALEGRDPRPLSDARPLRRQHRGHPRREPRLSRQGAAPADARRGGAARRAAAVAGSAAARPRRRRRARRARPRARARRRGRRPYQEDAAAARSEADARGAPHPFPMLAPHAAEPARRRSARRRVYPHNHDRRAGFRRGSSRSPPSAPRRSPIPSPSRSSSPITRAARSSPRSDRPGSSTSAATASST